MKDYEYTDNDMANRAAESLTEPYNHDMEADRIETKLRHDHFMLKQENHQLQHRIKMLEALLAEAWTLGADHRQPDFDRLNEWMRALLNLKLTPKYEHTN